MAADSLQQLLQEHAPHLVLIDDGKVKCQLNGHTMPARSDAVAAFVSGKKYRKLKEAADLEASLEKYEPFLVPSRNFPRMLYCALTDDLINRSLREVKQHIKGRKFSLAKERFQADKQGLHKEIDLLTSDPEDEDGGDEEGAEGEDGEGPGVWVPEEVLREEEMKDVEESAGPAGAGKEGEQQEAAAGGGPAEGEGANSMDEDGREQQPAAKGGKVAAKRKQRKQKAAKAPGGRKAAAAAAAQQQNGAGDDVVGKVKAPKTKRARAQ